MDYHYNKHDYGYDKKLQGLLNNTDLAVLSLMEIVERNTAVNSLPAGVYNNAGQLINHNLFWESMTPHASKRFPSGLSAELKEKLAKDFGSMDGFFKEFSQKSVSWFGSGWTYVAYHKPSDQVQIINTMNGNYLSPPSEYVALLNLDVWEHAYYIDYRNRRDAYVQAFLSVANWDNASELFAKIK